MNIAKIMVPKAFTVFLEEGQTVRQGWEIMSQTGYTAIPVLDSEQHYTGTVSEGDFLRHVLKTGSLDMQEMERYKVADIVRRQFCPPLAIDASTAQVVDAVMQQNFVPIVDNRNTLCGIVTRQGVISYLATKQ